MRTGCFAFCFLSLVLTCTLAPERATCCKISRRVCAYFLIKLTTAALTFFFFCPLFKHLAYNLATDKLKPLTLIANITPAIHPAPSQWEQLAVIISSHSLTPMCTRWGEKDRRRKQDSATYWRSYWTHQGRKKSGSCHHPPLFNSIHQEVYISLYTYRCKVLGKAVRPALTIKPRSLTCAQHLTKNRRKRHEARLTLHSVNYHDNKHRAE